MAAIAMPTPAQAEGDGHRSSADSTDSAKAHDAPKGISKGTDESPSQGSSKYHPASSPSPSSSNKPATPDEAAADSGRPPTRKRRRLSATQDASEVSTRKETFGAALARGLAGSAAFIFRAPVRVFRPSKLSSWSLLEAMAKREGKPLSLRYLRTLVRRERSTFLPHLLLPPILFNTAIGFILFESYSVVESRLLANFHPRRKDAIEAHNEAKANSRRHGGEEATNASPDQPFTPLWIVAIAGGSAGFAQSILSSPLDNVRLLITSAPAITAPGGAEGVKKNLRISWANIFKSALLPFAPAATRDRIADEVRASASAALRGARTGSTSSSQAQTTGAKASRFKLSSTASFPRDAKGNVDWAAVKAASQRWEKAVARLRGGMHGAGLVLSVVRDSVGYASFFFVFECSRRLAFASSRSVDAAIAFWNGTAALPQVGRGGFGAMDADVVTGEYRLGQGRSKSDGQVLQSDVAYTSSRTRAGRFVAGFVLLCGGTLGAVIYELVGRPAELMREVVWRGRARWAEGRQKSRDASSSTRSSSSSAETKAHTSPSAAWTGGGGRTAVVGGRVARELKSEAQGAYSRPGRSYSSFLELRAGNSAGSGTSRVSSARTLAHPRHPLKPTSEARPSSSHDIVEGKASAGATSHPQPATGRRLRPARVGERPTRSPTAPLQADRKARPRGPTTRSATAEPVLERRPTAVQLLIEHARRSSSLRFTTSNRDAEHTTPVPLPVLLLHTYFVAPFLMGETVRSLTAKVTQGASLDMAGTRTASKAEDARETKSRSAHDSSTPEEAMRRNWMMRHRVSSIFGNRFANLNTGGIGSRWRSNVEGSSTSSPSIHKAAASAPSSKVRWSASQSAAALLNRWPRMTFALRRLANPYGIAFLTFAWLGGDLA